MITPHCAGGEFQTAQQEGDDRMAKSTTTMPEQVCISKTEYDRRMEERRAAGLLIDPSTAEIDWNYAQTLDPYSDGLPLLPQEEQVGREYFARAPDSDIWVCVGDLPDATRDAIWKRLEEAA